MSKDSILPAFPKWVLKKKKYELRIMKMDLK